MTCLLDELNLILKKSKLNIPCHKQQVYTNGKNHKWLKKNFGHIEVTTCGVQTKKDRLLELVNMSINDLNKQL